MTFPNRRWGGSLVYPRSLFAAMRERSDVVAWIIAGRQRSGLRGGIRWLFYGARHDVSEKPPDILHCPDFVVPLRLNVPTVVTVHDGGARERRSPRPVGARFYEALMLPGRLRSAASLIATTEAIKREVVDRYGLDGDRVRVVHNGIDSRLLSSSLPDENGSGPPVILVPCARGANRELEVILRCLHASDSDAILGNATLEITGAEAGDFPPIARVVEDLGLESRVRWRGHLPLDEFRVAMARASVVAYMSSYAGFVFTPLEAMALGTPVVASNGGSLHEILGEAAVIVDHADERALRQALQSVLERKELRDKLRQAGWRHANSFTWTRCAEQTVEVYRAALDGHGPNGSPA